MIFYFDQNNLLSWFIRWKNSSCFTICAFVQCKFILISLLLAITQNVQEKLINVQDQIELEKRRNAELETRRVEEQKRAEEKIFEQQEHIQRLERTRYEAKLTELEQSFQTELDQMKNKERSHIQRINELEEKSAKLARTESMVKSLQAELPKVLTTFFWRR